jgi:hypothetical protein
MSIQGDLAEGSVFRWKAGAGTITSTIQRVEPPRLIAWTGGTLGIRADAEAGKNGFTPSGSPSLFQIVFQARAGWTCCKWPFGRKCR